MSLFGELMALKEISYQSLSSDFAPLSFWGIGGWRQADPESSLARNTEVLVH